MMPKTSPALFVSWKIESGIRYRGTLLVINYDRVRKEGFTARAIKSVPAKEVHFPSELIFPFADARKVSIKQMTPLASPADARLPTVLPFGDAAADAPAAVDSVPLGPTPRAKLPNGKGFRILPWMMSEDPTVGCPACDNMVSQRGHTHACRERFARKIADSMANNVEQIPALADAPDALRPVPDFPIEGVSSGEASGSGGPGKDISYLDEEQEVTEPPVVAPVDDEHMLGVMIGTEGEEDGSPGDDHGGGSATPGQGEVLPALAGTCPADQPRNLTVEYKENHNPYGTKVVLDMSDYTQDAITHWVKLTGSDREPKMAATPFCPAGSLPVQDYEVVGQLAKGCHSVVMRNMWLGRTARPDLWKPCNDLAGNMHQWSRNDDKYLQRCTIGILKQWGHQ